MQTLADETPAEEAAVDDTRSVGGRTPRADRLLRFSVRASGPFVAFVASVVAYCTAWWARGVYPFGSTPRGINDLANQYVPFHQNLWDLAHGEAAGDLLFNWRSGFGQQFLADYHTYLGNPLSLIALVFPREHVDVAVFLVTPLTMGLAAATMTVYLRHLVPGPRMLRATIGVAYGLCGWAVSDASYIPMWMWGLVSLPLLGIAMEWSLQGRRWVGATLLVTLAWTGNYYTAMMASLAAVILLFVRLATLDMDMRARVRAVLRAASAMALGAAVTLPLLLPSYLASKDAQPTLAGEFVAVPSDIFFASMLPTTHMWSGRPKMYIASLGLILALAFLLNRAIPARTRAVWGVTATLVAASFQWGPTQFLWHGLAIPNGNSYRETFVFSGLLAMMAWMCLANRPRMWTVGAAALFLVGLTFISRNVNDFGLYTWWAVIGGGALSLVGLAVLTASRTLATGTDPRRAALARRVLTPLAAVLLIGVVVAESAMSTAVADVRRARERWAGPVETSGKGFDAKLDATTTADDWPRHRTDPGKRGYTYNEPLRVRGEGPQYYSSYTTEKTFDTLSPLGFGGTNSGRTIFGVDNPVLDAIFSIGARVRPTNPTSTTYTTDRFPTPPLVTVHPENPTDLPAPGTTDGTAVTVWARQEALLGTPVYTVPDVRMTDQASGRPLEGNGPHKLTSKGRKTILATATCTPGQNVYWYSPTQQAELEQNGAKATSNGSRTTSQGSVVSVGTVPASGKVSVAVRPVANGDVPVHPIGCLDRTRLTAAVDDLTRTGATDVSVGGHSIRATLPQGSTGHAVIATVANKGWTCSQADGTPHEPQSRSGLISIPLRPGTTDIECSFTPPGLKAGLGGGIGALLVIIAVPAYTRWRKRQTDRPHHGASSVE